MQMVTKAKTCNLKKANEVYKLHAVPLLSSNEESETHPADRLRQKLSYTCLLNLVVTHSLAFS